MDNKKSVVMVGYDASFDSIKRIDPNGQKYWSARELSKILEYSEGQIGVS